MTLNIQPTEEGMLPAKQLVSKYRNHTFVRLPMEEGMVPVISLLFT